MDKNNPGNSQGQRGKEKEKEEQVMGWHQTNPHGNVFPSLQSEVRQGFPLGPLSYKGLLRSHWEWFRWYFLSKRAQITHSHTLGNTDSPAPQKSLTVRMEASLVTSLTQFRSSDVTNEVFLKLILSIGRSRPSIYRENKVPLTWSQLQSSENTGTIASEACSAPHTLDLLQPHPSPFLSFIDSLAGLQLVTW